MTEGRKTLPAQNAFFSGRENELARLHDALNNGGTAAVTQSVSGLGGIGKTALAVQYAHIYGAEYDHRLFCLADSPASLSSGFRTIASELALPTADDATDDEILNVVKHWLESTPRYLLILDNADFGEKLSPEQLKAFLPSPPSGHVLITTRAQTLHGTLNVTLDHTLTLGVMDANEAVTFLTERVKGKGAMLTGDEATAVTELAHEIGYLSLALEQAAAYIVQPGRTFRNYVNLYRKRLVAQVEKATPESGDYENTVATTWQISFEEVERVSAAATALLTLIAYLTSDDIPREVVYTAAQGLVPEIKDFFAGVINDDEAQERYTELLEPLSRYSLVTINAENTTFSIHRLVQAVIRHHQTDAERIKGKKMAIQVVDAAFPYFEFVKWEQCRRLLPCALVVKEYASLTECCNEDVGHFTNKVGCYLEAQGRYKEAESLYDIALKIRCTVLSYPHNDIATSLNNLAGLYLAQGRYNEADPLYKKSLAIAHAVLPPLDSGIAASINNLGALYYAQGRYREAESMYDEALTIARAAASPLHKDMAPTLNNLAGLYYAQGRYSEAEVLYDEALSIIRAVLPCPYDDIATTLNNLARVYYIQRRYKEAEAFYDEALTIVRAILPYPHNRIATSLINLALLYKVQGRYSEAEPMYDEALTIVRAVLPYPHNEIALCLNNLAALYQSQDRSGEAEPLYDEALQIRRAVLPYPHSDVAISLNNLALLYISQGRYAEAEPLSDEAFRIGSATIGVNHPDTEFCKSTLEWCREAIKVSNSNAALLEAISKSPVEGATVYINTVIVPGMPPLIYVSLAA